MTTLNKIGFWGWLILITTAIVFHIKSWDLSLAEKYAVYQEFWWFYIVITPVFLYMWFRD